MDGGPAGPDHPDCAAREERFPAGWTVSGRDGYSNDSVAGRERTAMAKTFTTAKTISQDVNCVDLVSTFPNGIVNVSATDKSIGSSGGLSDADVEEMVHEFQEQLSNTDDRMATVQKSIAELEDSAVKTTDEVSRNQHADDDALELFKATLPSTSLMQVQRGTLAKRELESLVGQAAQGLYSGETRHESRGNDVGLDEAHTLSRLVAKHVEVSRPRR